MELRKKVNEKKWNFENKQLGKNGFLKESNLEKMEL